jgi:dynein intermediate chain 1
VRSEAVVLVAAGGRVTQWTVANGLDHKDLVTLKKLKVLGKDDETQTLRYEDLHCISFSFSQPNIYVVGSEDGSLFVCDAQCNEDFIQKLDFHFWSVLSVKFSLIAPNWFLSRSCDGSAAIWNTKLQTPVAALYLGKATFCDINWSPLSVTVFGAACGDGECRIWDVGLDSVDPVAKLPPYDRNEFTTIDWSPQMPVLVAGNTVGVIYLTKVIGLASLTEGRAREVEIRRFESVIQMMFNQE